MPDYKKLTIVCKECVIEIEGFYRRDLEKENWHYYETINGDIAHIKKNAMVAVIVNAEKNNIEIFPISSND